MNNNEVNQSGSHPTEKHIEHHHYLKEISIQLFHNTKVKIATLLSVIFFLMGATWFYSEISRVNNFQSELENVNTKLLQLQNEHDVLQKEKAELSSTYSALQKTSKIPVLISPVDQRPIVGRHLTFRWKYSTDPGFQNLILELMKIDGNKTILRRFQIPEADRGHMFFEYPLKSSGHFFWRVGTGELLNDKNETRLWSRFGSFSLYPSVMDKIKDTNTLVVDTTVKFLSYDHPINSEGISNSYDMEFIHFIGKELTGELKLERNVSIRLKYFKWRDIFEGVINGDVDIAIANITKSKTREEKYQGILFTDGYRDNNQTFIRKKGNNPAIKDLIKDHDKIKKLLKDKTVAVQQKTTNLKVANELAKELEFEVVSGYSSYADVIDAVYKGKQEYGIIDSVRWESVPYPELEALNIDINQFLDKFYARELGQGYDHEEYAIVTSSALGNQSFVDRLNKIIDSKDGKAERKRLQKKHKLGGDVNRTTDFFQCEW